MSEDLREWWVDYLRSHAGHYANLLALVERCGEIRGLLDVGNFPGHFTILMRARGLDVAGIDIEPGRAGDLWARHDIDERQSDIEVDVFPFGDASFDVVVLGEVLEHLRVNPLHALRECLRVLRPGGHLVLSVPYVSPRHRLRFALGREYQGDIVEAFRKLETMGHMGHFRLYTRSEVLKLLAYAGFRPQSSRIAGELPGGRWRFVRYLGPLGDRFRSHLYTLAQRP